MQMRAVGYKVPSPIENEESLVDIDIPNPKISDHDLLVEIKAIAVNPVDVKVRSSTYPDENSYKILGWDAAGIVVNVGSAVTLFKPGDEVFYAGSLLRQGTYAQFHAVDERIVGRKPSSLSWAEAAALPLTSITAWESLFDRLNIQSTKEGQPKAAILIVGGAGGVGSMAIQLARRLTNFTVIATASRAESQAWVRDLGAHYVVDHSKPLAQEIKALDCGEIAFVFSTTDTDQHQSEIAQLIAPQGKLVLIDDPAIFNLNSFKKKSVSVHWEFMFTRSMFGTSDLADQGQLLNNISRLVDEGTIRTTLGRNLGRISAENIKYAHTLIEGKKTTGKIILEGF